MFDSFKPCFFSIQWDNDPLSDPYSFLRLHDHLVVGKADMWSLQHWISFLISWSNAEIVDGGVFVNCIILNILIYIYMYIYILYIYVIIFTFWLFNIAMENGP
jgi:hypothetical protein